MKIFNTSIIIFLYCLIAFCDQKGGIKMILDEKMLNIMLSSFYYRSLNNNDNTKISLPDIGMNRQLQFHIPYFTKDNIKFNFTEKGELTIKMFNLNTYLSGFNSFLNYKFNDSIGVLSFEQNVIIRSKINDSDSGEYIPVFEFKEDPIIDFEFNSFYNNEFIRDNIYQLLRNNTNKTFTNNFIIFINKTLNYIYEKIPKDVEFSNAGLRLDINMAGPIEPRKNSIQINIYGFLYYERNSKTQNKTKFPLSYIPSINKNNSNQLYISNYCISSAIYTFLLFHGRYQIVFYPNYLKFQYMFPRIREKYKTSIFYLFLTGTPDIKVELFEGSMNITFPATFEVKNLEKISLFISQVEIVLNAEINTVDYYPSRIRLFIKDINMKTLNIEKNDINNDTYFESQFQYGFGSLKGDIVEEYNKFIGQYYFFSELPSVMNVKFKNYKFEHKKDYVIMTYDYSKEF